MWKTRRNKKAVSPVIAALLLIAISVAAAVVTYSWVMSMIRSSGGQAQTAIRADEVLFGRFTNITGTYSGMKISIRNTGSVPATIQTIYLYKGDTQILKKDAIGVAIGAGVLMEFGLKETGTGGNWTSFLPLFGAEPAQTLETPFASDLLVASGYSVKVVTDTGFTVEGTYYTPSSFA